MAQTENWWSPSLQYSSRTDMGMRRSNNQDSYKSVPASTPRLFNDRGHCFVVADGMGAHAAGELASKLAVDIVSQSYLKRVTEPPYEAVRNAVLEAHAVIKKRGQEEASFQGMGTTCVCLLILPEGALMAHVGDSRIYRLRNGVMEQMTFDHSLLWELRRLGKLGSEKDEVNVPKNVITRSLGPTENLTVDLEGPFPCEIDDTFLLCSDGLSGLLSDEEMAQIIALLPPEEATEALINLANLHGGSDNITVTVVKIIGMSDVPRSKAKFGIYNKRPPLTILAQIFLTTAMVTFMTALVLLFMTIKSHCILSIVSGILSGALWGGFFYCAKDTLFVEKDASQKSPLGAGPYIRTPITLSKVFAEKLDRYRKEIKESVVQKNFNFDQQKLEALEKDIARYSSRKDLGGIMSAELRTINYFFAVIKRKAIS